MSGSDDEKAERKEGDGEKEKEMGGDGCHGPARSSGMQKRPKQGI